MRAPAGRPGRARLRRRRSSTCPGCTTPGLASWLGPVFAHTALRRPRGHRRSRPVLVVVDARGRRSLGLGARLRAVAGRGRPARPSSRPFLQRVWYWDDLYDTVIGRPGQAMARVAATVVDSPGHRRRGERGGHARAPQRRRRSARSRPATSATTPSASPSAWPRWSPSWSPGCGGREPPRLPLPDRAGAPAGRRRARPSAPAGPGRAARWSRAVGIAVALATLGFAIAAHRRACTPATAATSSCPTTSGRRRSGCPGTSGVDGISVFLVLMAAVLFPIALAGARARTDARSLHRLDAAARGGLHRQLRLARPGAVLLVLRADPGARRTSSSAAGASPAGPTRR